MTTGASLFGFSDETGYGAVTRDGEETAEALADAGLGDEDRDRQDPGLRLDLRPLAVSMR